MRIRGIRDRQLIITVTECETHGLDGRGALNVVPSNALAGRSPTESDQDDWSIYNMVIVVAISCDRRDVHLARVATI